jgi:hypothetical protein
VVELSVVDVAETTSHYVHAQNCRACIFVRHSTTLCVTRPHDSADLHEGRLGEFIIYLSTGDDIKQSALLEMKPHRAAAVLRQATAANRLIDLPVHPDPRSTYTGRHGGKVFFLRRGVQE